VRDEGREIEQGDRTDKIDCEAEREGQGGRADAGADARGRGRKSWVFVSASLFLGLEKNELRKREVVNNVAEPTNLLGLSLRIEDDLEPTNSRKTAHK
jgi:hypothetical protein